MSKEKLLIKLLEIALGITGVLVITSIIAMIYALFVYNFIPSVFIAASAIFYIIYDILVDKYNKVV